MNPVKFLLPSGIAIVMASCASQESAYDTSSPYGPGASSYPADQATQMYDTPSAYEDAGAGAPPAPDYGPAGGSVNLPATPSPAPAPTPAAGPGTVHVVVKGDTLSGIAAKYKVSIASIKAANNMTKDTVVLGSKIKIP